MSHSHSHSHGHDHDHNHDHTDDLEPAQQKHIYRQIEFDKITTLNESDPDAGAAIVRKTWAQRLDAEPMLASDADEQLLMTIPFAGTLRLHSLLLRSSPSSTAPRTLKLFLNRDDLDFAAAAALPATQTLALSQTADVQDIPVKRALFGNCYSLTLFFEQGFGAEVCELWYLGLKGDFVELSREAVEVLYEAVANPRDHEMIVGVGGTGMAEGQQR